MSHHEALAYLNGQLRTFEWVNSKLDKRYEFHLRDMREPHQGLPMPIDPTCIRTSFELQLLTMSGQLADTQPGDLNASYREADWNELTYALNHWLFKYVDDETNHVLTDANEAFRISSTNHQFRASLCMELTSQIKHITQADLLQFVDHASENQPQPFVGSVALFSTETKFFELRLGVRSEPTQEPDQ